MTNSAGKAEALDWLAGRVTWERLLDELRGPTSVHDADETEDQAAA